MGVSEEKRPSFWNSLGKNPKGDLPIQFTKVQTKERLGPGEGARRRALATSQPGGGYGTQRLPVLAHVHVHSKGEGAQGAALSSTSRIHLCPSPAVTPLTPVPLPACHWSVAPRVLGAAGEHAPPCCSPLSG